MEETDLFPYFTYLIKANLKFMLNLCLYGMYILRSKRLLISVTPRISLN
jgi:hypothetical protein